MSRPSATRSTLLVALLIALVIPLVSPAAARGADDAKVTASSKAAAKVEVEKAALHYKLGRFEEALAGYTRAYELYPAPALLFNIGQCHKNLRHHQRAIFFFQGYLREETDPAKRGLAEDLLANSRAELERERLAAVPPPAPPPVLLPPPAPPEATAQTSALTPSAAEEPAEKPVTRRWWFWTALGVGVAALAGGTIAYYASGQTTTVPPSGTVGTLDRR